MATINEAKDVIAAADVCGHVPLIKGLHGLGKSESAVAYAKENNMHCEVLILSLMDTGDMLGLPVTEKVGGMSATTWAAPTWYTNIVNAAWPEHLKVGRIQFVDTKFQQYAVEQINTLKETSDNIVINRKDLNTLYCNYYNLPNDRIQLLRQNNVRYLDSKRSVLFLDEFNRAATDILNASLQLILDHKLHAHELPIVHGKETLVIAAVNPADGDYTVQEFDNALLDRFVDITIEPDLKSWLDWARAKNVNEIVVDFLIDNKNKFHFTPADGSKGTSPRTWTRLGHYLDRIKDTPESALTHYVKGTIGSCAPSFISFYNNYSKNITTDTLTHAVKKEITSLKRRKKEITPEHLAKAIQPKVDELDAIRKLEFAVSFLDKHINLTGEKTLPMLAYFYALPIESLTATLKKIQSDSPEKYQKLAAIDKEINDKKLFFKIVSNIK